ncbi:type VI secretion system tip protein VgrG [Massilia antarctica]|uniref:Type VI secretion system tip protein VgrG n=1 Tax=Massilia antarctica TaxID=2765360 RepID=A0AA48WAL7_9BURK|nr:type VI secretion system tip protein VgrG [Massilia antarctica]QPI48912.1 type VI secretion system tip protein VgrG [Massilia antarctica]
MCPPPDSVSAPAPAAGPPSPALASKGVFKLVVKSGGAALPDSMRVIAVEVSRSVNKLSQARVYVADGDMAAKTFAVSDAKELVPGALIDIEAGYGSTTTPIFSGIVIKHAIRIDAGNRVRVCIECRHPAFALTLSRNNKNHVDSTDSDAITALLTGCGTVDVAETTSKYHGLVQYYSSDWDFLLARAEANGLLVITGDKSVTVKPPATSATAVLSLTYGTDIMRFEAEIDARSQYAKVTGVSWDPATQKIATQDATPADLSLQGNLDAATLGKVGAVPALRLQTPAPLDTAALTAWTKARQLKAALARVRGSMAFQGSALALPGTLIDLKGVGARFSGKVFVSSVEHHIADGNWITDVDFGLDPEWGGARQGGAGEAASGLMPGATGLHIGKVAKLDADPAGENRIQVTLPVLEDDAGGVWARLASAYGSDKVGAFFIPEIGDEVVVAYLNNDPSNPVVIASLYSSMRAPPYGLTAENYTKAIVTKGLLKVEFDDEKKVISLLTPAGNKVVMSDDAKSIVATDQNGNTVTLSDKGILLDSASDIVLTAKAKITITAGSDMALKASKDMTQDGENVTVKAGMGMVAKGATSAEFSAGGQTTIKGATVNIN